MPTQYDSTEFVDTDFAAPKPLYQNPGMSSGTSSGLRAPTREEVDSKVTETQQKLAELKRAQEELERERAALEEVRRRQTEFQTGRQEMIENLTRGLGLLEEAEFNARRDAEQMSRSVAGMRDALGKVQALNEDSWAKENFNVELTRALTTVENARLEWNAARLKFSVLAQPGATTDAPNRPASRTGLGAMSFGQLCKLGIALTLPLVVVTLLGFGLIVAVLWRGQ